MKSQIQSLKQLKQNLLTSKFKASSIDEVSIQMLQKQRQTLQKSYKQKIKKRKKFRKIVIGNQSSFDITQFFKFNKQKKIQTVTWIDYLKNGHWAWLALIYSIVNNSSILPWMMSIDADKWLRLAWRHILLNFVILPFIFYQIRKQKQKNSQVYNWQNLFQVNKLKNAFLVSLSKSLWFMVTTTCFQYSSIAHILMLSSLMNFFLSINRFMNSSYHFLQLGGQTFVIIAIAMIIKDQIFLDTSQVDTSYHNIAYTNYQYYTRVLIDGIAIILSIIMTITYKYTTSLNKDYTSYLGLFIVNTMIGIQMMVGSYFFHGSSLDFDYKFGLLGIFNAGHFVTFFQLSVVIGFGMLWSYTMISNLFSQPLLPALATQFEPILSLMFIDLIGIQPMPSGYTMMGYLFYLPGMFLIVIGQSAYQKLQKQSQKQLQNQIKAIFQMVNTRYVSQQLGLYQSPFLVKQTQSLGHSFKQSGFLQSNNISFGALQQQKQQANKIDYNNKFNKKDSYLTIQSMHDIKSQDKLQK